MKRLLRILGIFWRPVSVNAAFFVFMFVLGYFCTQTEIRQHLKGAKPYELSATELFFDLYLLCAVLALLPQKIRKWIRLLLAILLYIVALIDMFCYVRFESTLTPTMLMLFFEAHRAGDEGVPELVCGMGPADFQDRMDHPYCFLAYPVEYL